MGNKQSEQSEQSPPPPPAPPLRQPWREIGKKGRKAEWDEKMEQTLRDECLRADLELLGQRQVRILVMGASGSGKSSFIKSLYCALTDQMRQYTHCEASDTTVTQFLNHPPLSIERKSLYFRIQDAPGILEKDEDFYEDFVTLVLQGHLKEDVKLKPGAILKDGDHYVEKPEVMDRPCLVVFVLGPATLLHKSVLKRKLEIAKGQARQNKIKLAIVLTKADLRSADEMYPLKNANVKHIFNSQAVLTAVQTATSETGVPQNLIFPVTNYTEQTETCTEMNIVLLYTLSKLLSDAKLEAERRLEPERLEAERLKAERLEAERRLEPERRLEAERAAGPENPE